MVTAGGRWVHRNPCGFCVVKLPASHQRVVQASWEHVNHPREMAWPLAGDDTNYHLCRSRNSGTCST